MEPATLQYESTRGDTRGLAQLPGHDAQPRLTEGDFFASAPAEIGLLISADCNLRLDKPPKPFIVRLFIAGATSALILALFYWGSEQVSKRSDRQVLQSLGVIVALCAFPIYLFATRYKYTCTYVGDQGAARYTLKHHRMAAPRGEILLYQTAAEVHTSQTRQFANGVYTGTNYDYFWTDAAGKKILRLKGAHRGKDKPPKAGDAWHFANAAEIAFSNHYLARADQQLKADGWIAFGVDKKRTVRVGPGFIEFHFGGEPQRFTREDIAGVSLGGGHFSFKHKDAKWYSRAGKFNFSYGTMANAKVFLLALDKLMGYRWG